MRGTGAIRTRATRRRRPRPAAPATQPPVGRFPFLEIDARAKQVRVECEALAVDNPLEFFLCMAGTVEHEAVLRSKVRPSHLHAALLMLGLEPGEPVRFSESAKKWLPPHGPPLQTLGRSSRSDGKPVTLPAYRLMRDVKTKREMPPMTWIFAGSRMMPGDVYAADKTGYLVSVVNFDFTVIDIPELASNANETLLWQTQPGPRAAEGDEGHADHRAGGEGSGARPARRRSPWRRRRRRRRPGRSTRRCWPSPPTARSSSSIRSIRPTWWRR